MHERRLARERGGRAFALEARFAAEPAEPDAQHEARGRGQRARRPSAARDAASARHDAAAAMSRSRQRLVEPRIECIAQRGVLPLQIRDPRRQRRIARERLLHRRHAIGRQLAVELGVDVGVGDGQRIHGHLMNSPRALRAHFTIFSGVTLAPSANAARSFSRARDRRDITVPTGMPSTAAISS